MKILVIGSSSFAAQGLILLLQKSGHEIWSFNRRPEIALGERGLAGDPFKITDHRERLQGCEVVINYLILKDAPLERNLAYLSAVRELLNQVRCKRFIHISSVSVLPPVSGTVTEQDLPPEDFQQKGGYAQLKIATERWVTDHVTDCELVLVRPGFIVAPGLLDPIVGIGKLLPTQHLLGLGSRKSIIPTISRELLNEGIVRLCKIPLQERRTVIMFADPESPNRGEYLQYCCTQFGMGRGTLHLPPWFWILALAGASLPVSLLKRRWNNLPAKFRHNTKVRRYDCTASQRLLGLNYRRDWRTLFKDALEFQQPNFRQPVPFDSTRPSSQADAAMQSVAYVGLGRIAGDRHLPALSSLGHRGPVRWFDPFVQTLPPAKELALQRIDAVNDLEAARAVITTPVATRAELLRSLPDHVTELLFEKPFAIGPQQFDEIRQACGGRSVFVIHNYRFKENVQRALQYLATYNPGTLYETRLHFDSPSVDLDGAVWMRNERRARTLLIEYGLHFLDLAWLLADGDGQIKDLQVTKNLKGQTMCVQGTMGFANHSSRFLLRQGARQRRCQIEMIFQNYSILLRFFPDTFGVVHGEHTFADDLRMGYRGAVMTGKKVAEKLGLIAIEPSHERVIGGFLGLYGKQNVAGLSLATLKPFYNRLFRLAEAVYAE